VYRSRRSGRDCDLTRDWVEERLRQPCPRTGQPFALLAPNKRGFNDRDPYAPSLDRVDPNRGYTRDNVQVVAWAYNCAKQQRTDEELIELCRQIVTRANS